MPCYHMLKAFELGKKPNGKKLMKITSHKVDHIEFINGHANLIYSSEIFDKTSRVVNGIDIPCGQCIGCLIARSRDWATRLMCELESHKSAYFVTFTYNDEHIRFGTAVNSETGEIIEHPTLVKRDLQLFLKRLRKKFSEQKIRYFACGEYGSLYGRPHYHAIIYGVELSDLKLYKVNFNKDSLYTSDTFNSLWYDENDKEQLGYVVISKVTWETCAYVARYVTKKFIGQAFKDYEPLDLQNEYIVFSNKPGLANDYFYKHYDELINDWTIRISKKDGAKSFAPPKYFIKLLEQKDEKKYLELKEKLQIAAQSYMNLELSQTDLAFEDYYEMKKQKFLDKASLLKRSVPVNDDEDAILIDRIDESLVMLGDEFYETLEQNQERQDYFQQDSTENAEDEYIPEDFPWWNSPLSVYELLEQKKFKTHEQLYEESLKEMSLGSNAFLYED